MNIGKTLTDLRKQRGLSRQSLADKLEISVHTYIKYENESVKPPYETLIKIADFYSVSVDYLLGHKPAVNPIEVLDKIGMNKGALDTMEMYMQLPENVQKAIIDFIGQLIDAFNAEEPKKQRHVERLGDIEDELEQERQAKAKGETSCA